MLGLLRLIRTYISQHRKPAEMLCFQSIPALRSFASQLQSHGFFSGMIGTPECGRLGSTSITGSE